MTRVDRVSPNDSAEPVAWFVHREDADAYVKAFAVDPLNTKFCFRIEEE